MSSFVLAVIGGGNCGHTFAGLAPKEVETRVLTRRPKDWSQRIEVFYESDTTPINETNLSVISSNPEDVIPGSDLIVIGSPVYVYDEILARIAPYVDPHSHVGLLYAQGCTHFNAQALLPNAYFFGLQTIPWICKTIEYGRKARIIGPQKSLRVATNSPDTDKLSALLRSILRHSTIMYLPNFLSTTLTPSNQIIHTGRYYGIFHQWDGVSPYSEQDIPLLYEDMDEFSADCVEHLSDELQLIKQGIVKEFPEVNLDYVKPLDQRLAEDFFDLVKDKSSLKTIYATSYAHKGLKTPVREFKGGFAPNPDTRLFKDDVPYGLCIMKWYAQKLNIEVPWTDAMIEWHQKLMGKEYVVSGELVGKDAHECGTPTAYGVETLEDALI